MADGKRFQDASGSQLHPPQTELGPDASSTTRISNSHFLAFCTAFLPAVGGADGLPDLFPISPPLLPQSTELPPDVEPPKWTDVRQSLQNVTPGQSILLYARLEDDRGLASAILATNETGEWRNWTGRYSSPQVLRDETSAWVVFSWKNASVANGTRVGWRIWFSDSSNRWNSTSERSFDVHARQRLLPNRTPSNTIFVPNAACGVPFRPTITDAITVAGLGEPIIVCPGTYIESVVVDKNVILRGRDGPGTTIIDARSLSTAVQITSPEPLATVTGFTLRHSDFGVHVSANDAVVENVVLDEAGALGAGPNRGVHVDPGVTRAQINFTQSNGNRASVGVFVSENAQRVNITNSSLSNHAIGIHVQGLDGFSSRFVNITNVTVNNTTQTGILLEFADDVNVANSRITNLNAPPTARLGHALTAIRARGPNDRINIADVTITGSSRSTCCISAGIDINGALPNGTVVGPARNITVRRTGVSNLFGFGALGISVRNSFSNRVEDSTVAELRVPVAAVVAPPAAAGSPGGAVVVPPIPVITGAVGIFVEERGEPPAGVGPSVVRNNTAKGVGTFNITITDGNATGNATFLASGIGAGTENASLPVFVEDNRVEGTRGVIALGMAVGSNAIAGPSNVVNDTSGGVAAGIVTAGNTISNTISNTSGLVAAGISLVQLDPRFPISNITIENNTVSESVGNISVGIGFASGTDITVSGNTIFRNRGGVAIGVGATNGSGIIEDNTIWGNTGDPSLPVPLAAEPLPAVPVDLNGTGLGIGGINLSSGIIRSNNVFRNTGNLSASIALLGSKSNIVSGNTITRSLGNVSLGIGLVQNSTGNTIESNSVSDNAGNVAMGIGVLESAGNLVRNNIVLRSSGNALRSIGTAPPLLEDAVELLGREAGVGIAVLNASSVTILGSNASDNAGAKAAFGVVAVNATALRVNDTIVARNVGPSSIGIAAFDSVDVRIENSTAKQNVNATAAATGSDPPLDLGPPPLLPPSLRIVMPDDERARSLFTTFAGGYFDALRAMGASPWLSAGTEPVTERLERDFGPGTSAGVMVRNVTGASVNATRSFANGRFGILFNNSTNPPGVASTAFLGNSVSCFNEIDVRNDSDDTGLGTTLPPSTLYNTSFGIDDGVFKAGDCSSIALNVSSTVPSPVNRGSRFTISGTVNDLFGPVAGAEVVVQLIDSAGQILAVNNTTTDSAGSFSRTLLAPLVNGAYTVRTLAKNETSVAGRSVLRVGNDTDPLTVSGSPVPAPTKLNVTIQTDRPSYFTDQRVIFTGFVTDRTTGAPVVANVSINVTEFINATTTTYTLINTTSSIAGWFFNDTYFTPTEQFTYTVNATAVSGGATSDPTIFITVGTLPATATARFTRVGGSADLSVTVTNAGPTTRAGLRAVAFGANGTIGETPLPPLAPGASATVVITGPHGFPAGHHPVQVHIFGFRDEREGGAFVDLNVGEPRTLKREALVLLRSARALFASPLLDSAISEVNASIAGPWLDNSHLAWPAGSSVFEQERRAVEDVASLLSAPGLPAEVASLLASARERLVLADRFLAAFIVEDVEEFSEAAREAIDEVNNSLALPVVLRKQAVETFDDASNLTLTRTALKNGSLRLAEAPQNWTKHPANPVLSPTPAVADTQETRSPSVLFDNATGQFRMWYVGRGSTGDSFVAHATSPDGVNWTKTATVLRASGFGGAALDQQDPNNPSVLFDGSQFRMWYDAWGCAPGPVPPDTSPCARRIFAATSPNGLAWTKQGLVLEPAPSTFDQYEVHSPTVLFDGSQFRMWYTGYGCRAVNGDTRCENTIGHATSPNGVNWTKDSAPVLVPSRVTPTTVILNDTLDCAGCEVDLSQVTLNLDSSYLTASVFAHSVAGSASWCLNVDTDRNTATGTPVADIGADIVRCQSLFSSAFVYLYELGGGVKDIVVTDGAYQDFAPDVGHVSLTVPWDIYGVNGSTVLFDGSLYRMWYTGTGFGGNAIGYATSADGVNWMKRNGPVIVRGAPGSFDQDFVSEPSVLVDGAQFRMWYSGFGCQPSLCTYGIGHATSPDGIAWTKDPANPVVVPTPPEEVPFDAGSVGFAQVLFDDSLYRMWYTGGLGTLGSSIGLATSPDGVAWTKAGRVLVGGPEPIRFTDPEDCAGCPVDLKDVSIAIENFQLAVNVSAHSTSGSEVWCVHVDADRNPGTGTPVADIGAEFSQCQSIGSGPLVTSLPFNQGNFDLVVTDESLQDFAPDTGHFSLPVWDFLGVSAPAILFDPSDNLFKMWYSWVQAFGPGIGYATSPDGVNWTKHPDPVLTPAPVAPARSNFTDPLDCAGCALDVRDVNLTYQQGLFGSSLLTANITAYSSLQFSDTWCLYVDTDRNPFSGSPVADIGADTSSCAQLGSPINLQVFSPQQSVDVVVVGGTSDPRDFAPDSGHGTLTLSLAWDSQAVGLATVVLDGGVFKMWYSGGNPGSNQLAIGLATSADGINWTKHPANPVLTGRPGAWDPIVASPYVTNARGVFEMWYTGVTSFGPQQQFGIGYATSADGVTWTRLLPGPVLGPGPQGSWDSGFTALPSVVSVVVDGTSLRMWYTGAESSQLQDSKIGLAETPQFETSGFAVSAPVEEAFLIRKATANFTAVTPSGTNLTVLLSVDGGATFEPASSGVPITFATPGRSLVFRVNLSGDSNHTPSLPDLTIDYLLRPKLDAAEPVVGKIANMTALVNALVVSPSITDRLLNLLTEASTNLTAVIDRILAENGAGADAALLELRERLEDLVDEGLLAHARASLDAGLAAGETPGAVSDFAEAWDFAHRAIAGVIPAVAESVSGQLADGTRFEGSDPIRVIGS